MEQEVPRLAKLSQLGLHEALAVRFAPWSRRQLLAIAASKTSPRYVLASEALSNGRPLSPYNGSSFCGLSTEYKGNAEIDHSPRFDLCRRSRQ